MTGHNPHCIQIDTLEDAKNEIRKIGSDPKSIDIMAPKAILKVIKLENVVLQDAIIVKQDMLSIGGEVAVPKNAFALKERPASILIMGTINQLRELVQKLSRHYPRVQTISKELSQTIDEIV